MTESQEPRESEITSKDNDARIYSEFAARSDFLELRRRYRNFAFPATIAFMVWYVTYVICNNWARGFLDTPVIGNINVAVVFGLLQFLSTFVIAFMYARHANSALDPLASKLQDDFDVQTHRTKLDRQTGR
ncbi:MAG TPA: DUF485 domain-containing protein [Propionibacteriaceae bacterium]|nr:DUF485 domain-containing protein [Propionibacteriaceae bacterium]